MAKNIDGMLDQLVLIVVGVALIPTVFTAVSGANWSIAVGESTINLGFVGLIIALVFGLGLMGYRFKTGKR